MKKTILAFAICAGFLACNEAPKADATTTTDATTAAAGTGTTYNVDSTSTVSFVGTKPTGTHTGNFKVSQGSFAIADNNITSGSFTIDVNSLFVTDLKGEEKGQLEGHLKSPDFFDAAKYATAKFEVTNVAPYDSAKATSLLPGATHIISGNLTLKDSTKNVSFPAKVAVADNMVTAAADFNIDRTLWGLNYKGPNNPTDWVIKKEVNLKLNIVAKK